MRQHALPRGTQPAVPIEDDPRWIAVVDRDSRFDGTFVYSVKTTGIYCRPSCPSRLAKPGNIRFHAHCAAAEKAGFRPCLRCRPHEASLAHDHADLIVAACRRIETAQKQLSLDQLAKAAGLSPFHFHRLFKSITGLSPKAYGAAHRMNKIHKALSAGEESVTATIYASGYQSSSRFYATSKEMLGMTATAFREGGNLAEIRFALGETSLGSLLVACSAQGVCAIFLGDDPEALVHELQGRFPKAHLIGGDEGFEALVAKVVGFVETPARGLDLPLDIRGTAFQHKVWQALCEVPFGETASYTDIARRIGAPKAVRAVAQACAANKIAVAIPCHRILRTDGSLSGYRWGVERKRALLLKEGATKNSN
ncbi:bifunctional DNA-binding transcriptional regulator/O6-methylguanine-DNA methyltransferase Ada [Beijerinckia indica]|uniref:methylated-DNA--[protein]-cysteine S-methyltransferase n=1 Tax=Beijerinckia indica subsp. indica (strain ATCC 9039 / DSM 1715 / NCIMB 8712) TaxID=395963 RepID=B2IFZ9_BEII9|nr:bifunctional DNA-binding transcriptional regulator/O6-methylguanine-DNA methyltransferase Ada [Beijerinckia indica]ACB95738.1 transcriptional regulator, AraC family [Beijerinckia indica subsp. indica ATCC 9039]